MSCSSAQAEHGIDFEMNGSAKSRRDEIISSTDPFSFLNNPDLLSSISQSLSGGSGLPSQGTFLNSWPDANLPNSLNSLDTRSPLAQVDRYGTFLNEADPGSADAMNALLQSCFGPTAFPNNPTANAETMTNLSLALSLPFRGDDPTNFWDPFLATSTSSVAFAPSAESNEPFPELRTPLLSSTSPADSPSSVEGEKTDGQARQNIGLKTAHADTSIIDYSHKLPIPRLRPPTPVIPSKSAASSAQAVGPPSPSAVSTTSRTKLSHCAVERRYRTNMRQHIKNLREIVPALRVLELKTGNRISNLSLKPGTRRAGIDADADFGGKDVIDERGYIDGVKVARNGSKTTAIMKTIEYIRVLQRREIRLKHEQEGLKDLVRSFPGGSERLYQWEADWLEKHGGPEKDEIEELAEANEGGQNDEGVDSMDDMEGNTSMSGRENVKRPKTGVSSSSSDEGKKTVAARSDKSQTGDTLAPRKYISIRPAPSFDASGLPLAATPSLDQTGKRKRGRPRKNPLPPVTSPGGLAQDVPTHQPQPQVRPVAIAPQVPQRPSDVTQVGTPDSQTHQHDPRSGQYLFALFTFISFFTSPLPLHPTSFGMTRDAPHTRVHFGSVLTGNHVHSNLEEHGVSPITSVPLDWRDVIHLVHLAISVYFVMSFVQLRLSRLQHIFSKPLLLKWYQLRRTISSLPMALHGSPASVETRSNPGQMFREGARKLKELSNGRLVKPAVEAHIFREALGLLPGFSGFMRSLFNLLWPLEKHEYWRLERRLFMRLVELVALDANSSICTRLQMILNSFRYGHGCTVTGSELASIALVMYPIRRAKATGLWDVALARMHGRGASSPYIYRPYETFIPEVMSIDEAAQAITRLNRNAGARVMVIAPDNGLCRGEHSAHRDLASPLAALTRLMVHEYIRSQAESLFIQIASGEEEGEEGSSSSISSDSETIEYDRLLVAGRSLDPPTVALLNYFDQVLHSKLLDRDVKAEESIAEENVKEWGDFSHIHRELKALLDGILLCRSLEMGADEEGRTVDGASHRNPAQKHELRQVLSSTAFERTETLRSARDRVLDIHLTN